MKSKAVSRSAPRGTLYVVATPIGNMEDVTIRALKTLRQVELIVAENVRHTRLLCRRFAVATRVVSLNQHNQKTRAPGLIQRLKSGQAIALVSDAGTPGISDPGAYFIGRAVAEGLPVVPIPGVSAVTTALSVAGLPAEQFLFAGFMPPRAAARRKLLTELARETRTLVFFEAPHRVTDALRDLLAILGDRRAVLARELTKVFEDIRWTSLKALAVDLAPEATRGEFTLIVAGRPAGTEPVVSEDLQARMDDLLKTGEVRLRTVAAQLAEESGLPFRQVYRQCLARRRALADGSE